MCSERPQCSFGNTLHLDQIMLFAGLAALVAGLTNPISHCVELFLLRERIVLGSVEVSLERGQSVGGFTFVGKKVLFFQLLGLHRFNLDVQLGDFRSDPGRINSVAFGLTLLGDCDVLCQR